VYMCVCMYVYVCVCAYVCECCVCVCVCVCVCQAVHCATLEKEMSVAVEWLQKSKDRIEKGDEATRKLTGPCPL